MNGVTEEGLSTGRFDSDRGDLSFDSVPKVESPSGGVLSVSRVRAAWDNLRYSLNPILTSQITGLGSGGGGALGRSSSVRLGPGVSCDRIQRGNWVFPRLRSSPDDD